jgi:hypothetical protein
LILADDADKEWSRPPSCKCRKNHLVMRVRYEREFGWFPSSAVRPLR